MRVLRHAIFNGLFPLCFYSFASCDTPRGLHLSLESFMTRSSIFPFAIALLLGVFSATGCGKSVQVDKPDASDATSAGFDALSDAQKAEYEKEMPKQMGK